MPIQVSCPDCCSQLKVPDDFAGRKARCPRCDGVILVADLAEAEPVESVRKAVVAEVRAPTKPVESIRETVPRRKEPLEPTRPDDDEVDRTAEDSASSASGAELPRKKKKRRRKREKSSGAATWVLWLAAGGVAAVCVFTVLYVVLIGMKREALMYCIIMAVLLPVSTGILILSMFITSALGGGVDFGEARTAIPKAAALLLIINLISLAPLGGMLTFPVWLIGLMVLFKLDLWETRILMVVNWCFNFAARWVVLTAVLTSMSNGSGLGNPTFTDAEPGVEMEKQEGSAAIAALGGEYGYAAGPGSPIVSINLRNSRMTDRDLYHLKDFPELRTLDLSNTPITDAGLEELSDLDQLEVLIVRNTRVTKVGTKKLQRALPALKIVH